MYKISWRSSSYLQRATWPQKAAREKFNSPSRTDETVLAERLNEGTTDEVEAKLKRVEKEDMARKGRGGR